VQIYYGLGFIFMNNSTTSRMSLFIIAAALLTAVMTTTTVGMVPAAYAGGDDDGDDQKDGDGNKQQVEDESAGAIADCDENHVSENAHFECHASNGIRFTGQDVMINGISKTLLSDEPDPSPQTMDWSPQIMDSLTDLPLPL
jgi:hypothetical protein